MGQSDIAFKVKSGVRQGCVMSVVLFNIVIKKTMEGPTRRIRLTLFSSLEDIDFTDDIALMSHTRQHLHEKTSKRNDIIQKWGLSLSLSVVHRARWCRVSSTCFARRWDISPFLAEKPLPQLTQKMIGAESHVEDCDHVGIFVIYFLQYDSFICKWPASTVVDPVQEPPRCLWRCV